MKKVIFRPNPFKPDAVRCAARLLERAASLGAEALVPCSAAEIFPEGTAFTAVKDEDIYAEGDLLVIVGGDGSILHEAASAARYELPVLGVNMGKLGFLTEIEPTEIGLFDRVIKGDYETDKRMMLDVIVSRGGECIYKKAALNEIIITKGDISHTIAVGICVNGRPMVRWSGDGVIVSTPTGSTAYSMSAGGPILEPDAQSIIVTPVCAHAFHAHSFVLQSDRKLDISVSLFQNKTACISVDGGDAVNISGDEKITIERSAYEMRLVRVNGRGFGELIDQKFSKGSLI